MEEGTRIEGETEKSLSSRERYYRSELFFIRNDRGERERNRSCLALISSVARYLSTLPSSPQRKLDRGMHTVDTNLPFYSLSFSTIFHFVSSSIVVSLFYSPVYVGSRCFSFRALSPSDSQTLVVNNPTRKVNAASRPRYVTSRLQHRLQTASKTTCHRPTGRTTANPVARRPQIFTRIKNVQTWFLARAKTKSIRLPVELKSCTNSVRSSSFCLSLAARQLFPRYSSPT